MTKTVPNSLTQKCRTWILPIALALLFCCSTTAAVKSPVSGWQFSQEITPTQRTELKAWLTEVQRGLNRLLGPFPDQHEIHIKQQASSGSPVPWARTAKGTTRQIHFIVDTSKPWTAFRKDWTAAHEVSHMLFPYVGEDRWFAEGLASYLQYQVMYAAGHISWDAAAAKIEERFRRVKNSKVPNSWSVLKHNARLRQERDYPRLYWGGAAFFAMVDQHLTQDHNMRLTQVISAYTQCCYSPVPTRAMNLLKLFDELSETTVFLTTYRQEMLSDQTPNTKHLGEWLRATPPHLFE